MIYIHKNTSTFFKRETQLITLIIEIIMPTSRVDSVFLSNFSLNLLAFYHEWNALISYVTHRLFYLMLNLKEKREKKLIAISIVCLPQLSQFIYRVFLRTSTG